MPEMEEGRLQKEMETYVECLTQTSLPVTPERLEVYRIAQEQHPVCHQVQQFCMSVATKEVHFSQAVTLFQVQG